MSVTDDMLAELFTEQRVHLVAVAYRLTGRVSDAEDAVQEAWLRLAGLGDAGRAQIRDLRAWLTTVVGRICLDQLKSAASLRERYVGSWLPEPLVTPISGEDPLDVVVRDDGVRMAALVVLHELSAEQRVAFVLHDAFGVPFTEIAGALGCSPAAARQHASRGRKAVADANTPPRSELDEQHAVLEAFMTALAAGDTTQVMRLLHPGVVVVGDGGGQVRTVIRTVKGVEKVTRFALGLWRSYGSAAHQSLRFMLVNGDAGMLSAGTDGAGGERGLAPRVTTFLVHDGKIAAVYDVANPDKLGHVRFER